MYRAAHKRTYTIFVFFSLMLAVTLPALATPAPPTQVELTRAEMQNKQFTFKIRKDGARTSINLHFPGRLLAKEFRLVPHSTSVLIRNKAGDDIAMTDNWVANNEVLSIDTSYNHLTADASVAITYVCAKAGNDGCYGATIFRMSSISKFIEANPDAVNLPLTCKKVPGTAIEMFDCTQ